MLVDSVGGSLSGPAVMEEEGSLGMEMRMNRTFLIW